MECALPQSLICTTWSISFGSLSINQVVHFRSSKTRPHQPLYENCPSEAPFPDGSNIVSCNESTITKPYQGATYCHRYFKFLALFLSLLKYAKWHRLLTNNSSFKKLSFASLDLNLLEWDEDPLLRSLAHAWKHRSYAHHQLTKHVSLRKTASLTKN